MGILCKEGKEWVESIGEDLKRKISDLKSKSYFIQKISDVQRENAATTISSLPAAEGFEAVFGLIR